jgi:hypothetical protein
MSQCASLAAACCANQNGSEPGVGWCSDASDESFRIAAVGYLDNLFAHIRTLGRFRQGKVASKPGIIPC